jgi:hypothetical protein
VAEQGCLLSSYTSKGCRGFESPPLRQESLVRASLPCAIPSHRLLAFEVERFNRFGNGQDAFRTWPGVISLSQNRQQIRLLEVVTLEQDRLTYGLCQSIGKAISEIQPCGMPTLPVFAPG